MSFVQREIERLAKVCAMAKDAELEATIREAYIAQHTLQWALDPSAYRTATEFVMGTITAENQIIASKNEEIYKKITGQN